MKVRAPLLPDMLQRGLQARGALVQTFALLRRQLRLQHRNYAGAADDARQRQRDAERRLVAADRDRRALVTQHHFGNARRYDADAVLAGIVPLDDGDVGVADVALELGAHVVELFAAL